MYRFTYSLCHPKGADDRSDETHIRDGSKCTRTHEYFLQYLVLVLEYFLQTAINTHTSTQVL